MRETIPDYIAAFLERSGKKMEEIDLVLLGISGDPADDMVYNGVRNHLFRDKSMAWFKHLCGEYQTASSFGLWLTAMILKNKQVPEIVRLEGAAPRNLKNILIYNHYRNLDHSLMLVSSV